VLVLAGAAVAGTGAVVTQASLRVITPQVPAAGYFDLYNPGEKPLVLIGAHSPACAAMMMHRSEDTGGISRMRGLDAVTVAPHSHAVFAPGGYHLMCLPPKAGLTSGDSVPVTLVFAGGFALAVPFAVTGVRSRGH
jgi:copper(I)-binding protein